MPAASSKAPAPMRSMRGHAIPTRSACCAPCRDSTSRRPTDWCRSRASRPTRSPCRRAAPSGRAAPMPSRAARWSGPSCAASPTATRWPAGSTSVTEAADKPLVEVRGLNVHFPVAGGLGRRRPAAVVHAVDGVDLDIARGEALGLVGESGCGKSTFGRAILQLVRPTAGEVRFDGCELTTLAEEALRLMRRRMQMVFQDPFSSLNPRMTVGDAVAEPMLTHGLATRADCHDKAAELFRIVGLNPGMLGRYPHEFSGGQRQRIGIARALA